MNSTSREISPDSRSESKVIKIIQDINKKIDYLIDCSSKDFVVLNQNFKQYHNDIDKSAANLDKLLELFGEKVKILSPIEITDLTLNLQNIVKKIDKRISSIISISTEIEKNLNYLLLPINNAKQDISTLRLIVTNLQFDPHFKDDHKDMSDTLLNLSNCFESIENKTVALKNNIDSYSISLERKAKKLVVVIQSTLQYYNALYDFFMKKRSEAEEYKPIVKELKSKKTDSSSLIITNLQYQDIIRQKIEHVQLAQDKVIENITAANKKTKKAKQNKQSIRHLLHDIGSLQAAQLVHANQKYQTAIDTIIEKFKELDHTLNKVAEISKDISNIEEFPETISFFEQHTVAKKTLKYFNEFKNLIESFFIKAEGVQTQSKLLVEKNKKLNSTKLSLKSLAEKVEKLSNENTYQGNLKNSINQFIGIISDIYANIDRIESLLSANHKNIQKISSSKSKDELLNSSKTAIDSFNKLSESFMKFVDENNQTFRLLDENIIEYQPGTGTDFSIDNVKYYKMFEAEIENIINQINYLTSIYNSDSAETDRQEENLDFLKKLYSMKSERIVHEYVTGKDEDKEMKEDGEDEGSLELF